MYDNTVKTDFNSTDFHLLQTSLSASTLQTTLYTTHRLRLQPLPACLCNRDGRLADRTAVVTSQLHNHAAHQPFYNCPVW